MSFLAVAAGGAVGAALRYSVSLIPFKSTFPWQTLVTNILGAVLIGFIVATAEQKDISANAVLFLKTGVCGGFTTFSTFSLEAYELFGSGPRPLAVLYILLSVFCCIAGVWCGMAAAKTVI